MAGLWCTLPEFLRTRPYVEASFKKKVVELSKWKWDDDFKKCPLPQSPSATATASKPLPAKMPARMPQPARPMVQPAAARIAPSTMETYTAPVIPVKAGLSTAAKAGIGVGVLAAVGVGAWMFMRK